MYAVLFGTALKTTPSKPYLSAVPTCLHSFRSEQNPQDHLVQAGPKCGGGPRDGCCTMGTRTLAAVHFFRGLAVSGEV